MDAVSSLPRLSDPINSVFEFPGLGFVFGDAIIAVFQRLCEIAYPFVPLDVARTPVAGSVQAFVPLKNDPLGAQSPHGALVALLVEARDFLCLLVLGSLRIRIEIDAGAQVSRIVDTNHLVVDGQLIRARREAFYL